MNEFDFIFTLVGLLLGLALAEGLGGLAKAVKASHKVRIGLPTALLGVFVSCDVVTFWIYGWALREKLALTWPVLFAGFVIAGLYYVSAALVFPDEPEEWGDLDSHFDKHSRKVLAGVFLCNVALMTTTVALKVRLALDLRAFVVTWSFFPVALGAIVVNRRAARVACLAWLVVLYPLSVIWA